MSSNVNASQSHMLDQIARGAGSNPAPQDASSKRILSRGCDPVMAARYLESYDTQASSFSCLSRASQMLPPMLGNALFEGVTDDETFFSKLSQGQWDVVFLAPGMCRRDPNTVAAYRDQVKTTSNPSKSLCQQTAISKRITFTCVTVLRLCYHIFSPILRHFDSWTSVR